MGLAPAEGFCGTMLTTRPSLDMLVPAELDWEVKIQVFDPT